MWISRRKLESVVRDTIAQALREAGSNQNTGGSQALAGALEGFLTRAVDAQAKNLEAMGSFMQSVGDLSVRRAAAALGSRGGQARARNAAVKKATNQPSNECAVCRDPMSRDPGAILKHVNEGHDMRRAHEEQRRAEMVAEHDRFVRAGGVAS